MQYINTHFSDSRDAAWPGPGIFGRNWSVPVKTGCNLNILLPSGSLYPRHVPTRNICTQQQWPGRSLTAADFGKGIPNLGPSSCACCSSPGISPSPKIRKPFEVLLPLWAGHEGRTFLGFVASFLAGSKCSLWDFQAPPALHQVPSPLPG